MLRLKRHRCTLFTLAFFPLVVWFVLGWMLAGHPAFFPATLQDSKSTLLVVAHPDDECLFFSPSVLWASTRAHAATSILVLSSGNHYGLGDLRRTELEGSCEQLGVPKSRCEVLDLPDIQDDPHEWWSVEEIIDVVKDRVRKYNVDVIITFDAGGVSGHINHRAVSAAVTQYAVNTPGAPAVYLSQTVNVVRKYIGLFDLPLSALPFLPNLIFHRWGDQHLTFSSSSPSEAVAPMSPPYNAHTESDKSLSEIRRKERGPGERALLVGDISMYFAARHAFASHASQLVWDRYLYMVLSRYM